MWEEGGDEGGSVRKQKVRYERNRAEKDGKGWEV